MSLTVGELRAILFELPADLEIAIPGGEYDYQDVATAHIIEGMNWMNYDEDHDTFAPHKVTMLVIEP